ncbi:unnamed protein product [Meloidogyne enterolobii]|uniref:Uncharacterized protein n=1 Tax=Meloidogyne enterolobii TaxID=390850 RepID=A0ACB0YQK8_MELEN
MFSLPREVQLDIFKFLSYEKLYSIKHMHLYFCDFINNYEEELAREKFYGISIVIFLNLIFKKFFLKDIDRFKKGPYSKLIELKAKNLNFPLNEEIEEKWRNRRETQIPLYLVPRNANNIVICLSKVFETECHLLQLPNFIKNKIDLKIVYYYLNKLFNCYFEEGNFRGFILNPKLIQLLFGNVPKQFYIQNSWLFMDYVIGDKFQFILNHLFISGTLTINFPLDKDATKYTDILFKILMNGDKFNEVCLKCINLQEIFDRIIDVSFCAYFYILVQTGLIYLVS